MHAFFSDRKAENAELRQLLGLESVTLVRRSFDMWNIKMTLNESVTVLYVRLLHQNLNLKLVRIGLD